MRTTCSGINGREVPQLDWVPKEGHGRGRNNAVPRPWSGKGFTTQGIGGILKMGRKIHGKKKNKRVETKQKGLVSTKERRLVWRTGWGEQFHTERVGRRKFQGGGRIAKTRGKKQREEKRGT